VDGLSRPRRTVIKHLWSRLLQVRALPPGAIALLRERLGDDSFAAAFARGEGLAPGDVIAAIVT
jgi:hypothetical protein